MTHTEEIMRAVFILVKQKGKRVFSRKEIRECIGLNQKEWTYKYSPIFQGMRAYPRGKSPSVPKRFRDIFRQVERGKYNLTNKGQQLLKEFKVGLDYYDFVEVGKWSLKKTRKSGIAFELCRLEDERVIYAFVADSEMKYIGVCEKNTTTLKNRMNRYQGLQGGSTNKRIANEIKDHLKQGKPVKIFALKPGTSCRYKDLNADLVRGLENPLIEKLKPKWNK